jgi:hypothetical protein
VSVTTVDSITNNVAEATVELDRYAVLEAVILGGKVMAKSVGPQEVVLKVLDSFKPVEFDA